MVSVRVRYLFYQPMETCTLRFPAKENPNMKKALFDWSIVSQYDVKAKYRLISRNFLGVYYGGRYRHYTQIIDGKTYTNLEKNMQT